jgi:hypothetical protein
MLKASPSPTFDNGIDTVPFVTDSVIELEAGALGTGSEPSGLLAELGSGATVTRTRLRG